RLIRPLTCPSLSERQPRCCAPLPCRWQRLRWRRPARPRSQPVKLRTRTKCPSRTSISQQPFLIVLGAHSLKTPEASRQTFGIQQSVAHPLYDAGTVRNDIRLLKLNGSVIFNRDVRRIRLPRMNTDPHPGVRCQVTGWGDISNFGTIPTKLMETNVTIVDRKACNASWAGNVFNGMLCAANTSPALRGFCSGDSGGPLLCGSRVQGIVSFNGKRCGDRRYPDIYTRISKYILWVRYILKMY
uniref:Phosphatidylinositol-4-phosphate 5-kinase type 1 gamma n=1 Tax=Varanus komodoensis TaxID=61221 RepID=A0A8D2LA22_VARKO